MLGCVVVFLTAVLSVGCYTVPDIHERLIHGRQLKIYLPKSTEKLVFSPMEQPGTVMVYWQKNRHTSSKGSISGSGNDRRWTLDKVTYADQGTYSQMNFWDKEISSIKVAVNPRRVYVTRVAGQTLSVSMEGINPMEATLSFSGDSANITLVRDGAVISQDLPDYWDRVRLGRQSIEVREVNTSDVGRYTLRDRQNRVVSVTRMDLTDHQDVTSGNPLLALLLLLGIPAGICCCCRKKIFKQKASTSTTLQATPEMQHPPTGGPAGAPPSYHPAPGDPTVFYHGPNAGPSVQPPPDGGQWNGPTPSPGFNPAYPPANPAYPPVGPGYPPVGPGYPPVGPGYMPPTQPPQWNAPAPGPYPPGPAPMGYAPVMYSVPPEGAAAQAAEEMKSSPVAPLLAPQVDATSAPPVPPNPAQPSQSAHQFQIEAGKNTSNFL